LRADTDCEHGYRAAAEPPRGKNSMRSFEKNNWMNK
jgi:hypothetical protein